MLDECCTRFMTSAPAKVSGDDALPEAPVDYIESPYVCWWRSARELPTARANNSSTFTVYSPSVAMHLVRKANPGKSIE